MTRRAVAVLLAVSSVLWTGPAWAGVTVTHPYHGVRLITRTDTSPRNVAMHIVEIDLNAPGIRFKLTPPGGPLDTIRQTTLAFLNQEHAALAINCHFMVPFPAIDATANLVGLAVSEGIVYSPFEPQPISAQYVDQSYAILPFTPALNLDPWNRASVVHLDPAFPDNCGVLEDAILWNAVSGSAQIITAGMKTLPSYSGSSTELNPLNGFSNDNSWYARARARTVIGLTRDGGRLVLFTVDEAGGSAGMTLSEVADVLIRDYHVRDAINLDGGGSTSLAIRDPFTGIGRLVNVPSDPPLGRAVGSSLAVFAEPIFDPAMRLSLSLSPTNSIVISWPAPAPGWVLQRNPDLNPTHWTDASQLPQQVGDSLQIILAPGDAPGFYRLRK